MWSMKDMFYGESEPVWILKPEKEDNKKRDSSSTGGAASSRKEAERAADYSSSTGGAGVGSSRRKEAERAEDYSMLSSGPYYPYYSADYIPPPPAPRREESYYYPDYIPPPPRPRREEAKPAIASQQKKDTKVVLKVPICCGECVESIEAALYGLKGVKSVECDSYRERVTVVATTAAPADILAQCRKVFRKSRFWTDEDY